MVTISLLMPLALLQLEYAMTRYLTFEKDALLINKGVSSILSGVTLFTVLISLVIYIFSGELALFLLKSSSYAIILKVSSLLLIITTLDQIILRYFISFRKMIRYTVIQIAQTALELSFIIMAVFLNLQILGVLVALLIARIVVLILSYKYLVYEIQITTPDYSLLKVYAAFSIPLIPFTLSNWLINSGDIYVISYYLDSVQVGLYAAAYNIGNIISFLYTPIALVLLPAITELHKKGLNQEIQRHLKYTLKLFMLVAIPSLFGISLLAKPILSILATSEFSVASSIVPLIAAGTLLFGVSNMFGDVAILHNKTRIISITYGLSAFTNIGLNILLIPKYGIDGAGFSTLVTFLLICIVQVIVSKDYFKNSVDFVFLVKSLVASMGMSLIILYLWPKGLTQVGLTIAISIIAYLLVLYLLGGFSSKEKLFIRQTLSETIQLIQKRSLSIVFVNDITYGVQGRTSRLYWITFDNCAHTGPR